MKWNMSGSRSDSGVLGRATKVSPSLFLVSFSKTKKVARVRIVVFWSDEGFGFLSI